jgi:hypothetical protein
MRQQNFIETAKAKTAAQQLALRTFTAVDHKAVFIDHHHSRRETALRRWRRGRGAQKDEFEHNARIVTQGDKNGEILGAGNDAENDRGNN